MYSKLKERLGGTGLALLGVLILVVASIAVPATAQPVASMSASVAKQVRQALGLAKRATKRSNQAVKLARAANKKAGQPGARGPAGPAGPQGLAGARGAQGERGPAGTNGQPGSNGANGTSVTGEELAPGEGGCVEGGVEYTSASGTDVVCNGEKGAQGEQGPDGSPWTLGGFLPSGETLVGSWGMGPAAAGTAVAMPLSFPLRLDPETVTTINGDSARRVVVSNPPPDPAPVGCPGTVTNPHALPGYICVYEGFVDGAQPLTPGGQVGQSITRPSGSFGSFGIESAGSILTYVTTAANGLARGTFAVTAN